VVIYLCWPVRTAPSITEAAVIRIAQGTKVLAEGGHNKIFRQAFSAPPDEMLRKSYACYLSTSAGPVLGILYLSTARVAFCSDNPLSYEAAGGDTTEWSYYKVTEESYTRIMFLPSCNCSVFCSVACGEMMMMMMEYAQVAIPLHRLRAASASVSKAKPAEKFIQLVSVDMHEFWFMGFVNYDSAAMHLQEALSGFHHLRA
jgi:hypothetical protein